MLTYAQALADFAHALEEDTFVPPQMTDDSVAHMAIYRNNVRLNRIDALPSAFPQVAELVGDEFFRAMAREYVRATPAASANLHDDGHALPAFIAQFAPAAGLPYLADVARVDWAQHQAYYAPDVPPLAQAVLAQIDPARFADMQLLFHPAVAVVGSARWPLADLLAMHQGGPVAQLDAGGQNVLVWRNAGQVHGQALSADDALVLLPLLAGQAVGDALAVAVSDPNPLLAQVFSLGLLTDIKDTNP